jgi:hypothetical protein
MTHLQEYTSKWATVLVTKPGATIAAAATVPLTVIVIMALHLPPPRASLRAPAAIPAAVMAVVVVTDKDGELWIGFGAQKIVIFNEAVFYAWEGNVIILRRMASTSELRCIHHLLFKVLCRSYQSSRCEQV